MINIIIYLGGGGGSSKVATTDSVGVRLLRIVLFLNIREHQRGAIHFSRLHSIFLPFLIAMENFDTK